jgi:multidrug efflux pump subunit AcrB
MLENITVTGNTENEVKKKGRKPTQVNYFDVKEELAVVAFINAKNIPGIERLSIDVNKESPELEVKVDRVNAGSLGVSTGQLGFNLRRSVYGQEISTYKEGDDDYNITMRMQDNQRKNENICLPHSKPMKIEGEEECCFFFLALGCLSLS